MNRISQVAVEVVLQDTGGASRVTQVAVEAVVDDFGETRVTHHQVQLAGESDGAARVTYNTANFAGANDPEDAEIRVTHLTDNFLGAQNPEEAEIRATWLSVQVVFIRRKDLVPGEDVEIRSCLCNGPTPLPVECIGAPEGIPMGGSCLTSVLPDRVCVAADGGVCTTITIPGEDVIVDSLGEGHVTHLQVQMLRVRLT